MAKGKIWVTGIGPGSDDDITHAAEKAISCAEVVVGYKYYFDFVDKIISPDAIRVDTGMKKEKERAEIAFDYAEKGKNVCVISSGDAGIYGMSPLIHELAAVNKSDIEIEVIPGISAFQKAAAILGAPVGHDMCIISLSNLMTPWNIIEKRIKAAAESDFVTAIYNPISNGRFWQLHRLKEIFMKYRIASTAVGVVNQAGRDGQSVFYKTLAEFDPNEADMFTVIIIGNSQSFFYNSANDSSMRFVTPRGYNIKNKNDEDESLGIGRKIMTDSFRTIIKELKNSDLSIDKLWVILHLIHTTADFEMESLVNIDEYAVAGIFDKIREGKITHIITDVTMVQSGIRKSAIERFGIEVKCYLNEQGVYENAIKNGITRSQSGIRLAVEEHPDALFVFGNAPTALMELAFMIKEGRAHPSGIIAAPVGFIHVEESKHMIKPFFDIPKIIIEGRKGGSNVAATIVNAVLSFDDAQDLLPGRGV